MIYKPGKIIYIDSNGGSVDKGEDFIDFIVANNISCYAKKAHSMAFSIYNYCKERYYSYDSEFIQHDIIIDLKLLGRKTISLTELTKLVKEANEQNDKFSLNSANRLGIPYDKYKKLIEKEYNFKSNMTFFREINMGQMVAII